MDAVTEDAEHGTGTHDVGVKTFLPEVSDSRKQEEWYAKIEINMNVTHWYLAHINTLTKFAYFYQDDS